MNHGISVSFSPIGGSWPVLLLAIMAVTALDALGLRQAVERNDRPVAMVCTFASAAGDSAVPHGGPAAEGHAQ